MIITSATLVAEVVGGIFTGSLALLSDAAHVFLDIFALALSYFAVRMSKRAATVRHSYGFFRMKVLAAFINGGMLILVALEIVREAIGRFSNPQQVIAGPMLIIAFIGLAANLLVAFVLKDHEHEDINARAAFLHVIGDALSSIGVILAGVLIMVTGWYWCDPLASLLIAFIIFRGAFGVLKEATHILSEGTPDNADIDHVAQSILKIEDVRSVHDVHVWALEPGLKILTAHIVLEDRLLSATSRIMERIKNMLKKDFSIDHTTIQFECGDCGQCRENGGLHDSEANDLAPAIRAVLFDMDGVLVDSERLIAEASQRMFAEHYQCKVLLEDFVPFIGAGENRYIGSVAEKYHIEIDLDAAKAWTYEIYGQLARAHALGMREIPGAVRYVRACRDAGLKTALASAADKVKVLINLEYLQLDPKEFDTILTGEDVINKKPDPEMYLKAAERIGFDPHMCIVVEDAMNGTIAGVKAGARVLGITSSFSEKQLRDAGATWIAKDLASAPHPWE